MLPKKHKLTKEKDFQRVFKEGKYYQQNFITLKMVKNSLKTSRFGFVIGLKISKKATVRNKIRRRLNEIIRLNLDQIKPGFDLVILPKLEIAEKNYQEIKENLIILLKKARMLS
jgi:ribonuclease P protein component